MKTILTVTEPFGGYERGQQITAAKEIAAILAGENAHRVVQTLPAEPPADPAPK